MSTEIRYKLETRGLAKRYDDVLALAPIDLTVKAGEFLTLLGPSGSGKTTLLQVIAGLVNPSEGSLIIDGTDSTELPPGKRGIGMVFQSYALFPHMTVFENIAYPLRMRGLKHVEVAPAVEAALGMVQMEEFGNRYPHQLSGGQQQRIALARCFVYKPSVILLDEPLGALDKRLREHMQLEISHLHKKLGDTFIYVTHDQEEALTLSDRICLMNHGCVEQVGSPNDIYYHPSSRFVADFIGHSNILEGTKNVGPDGCVTLAYDGSQLPLSPVSENLPDNFTLLVRPECAKLTDPMSGLLTGTVEEMVFVGSDIRVMVSSGGSSPFIVRCARSEAPNIGDRVGITWDVEDAAPLTR